MKIQHKLTLVALSVLFFACGGAKQEKKEDANKEEKVENKEEKTETKEEAKAFDKKVYVDYSIDGYKKAGDPVDSEKSVAISFFPESKDKIRSVDISVDKLNDAAYLESEEAYKEYYKSMMKNDNATVTMVEKDGKKVFYYKFEDKMMGKAVKATFLGKENHSVSFTAIEASKGKLAAYTDLEAELDKFINLALKK
ncbi:MAG: hypothetical protein EAZ55_14300 [Cytophagales bacterium]|nr:MAG: hypothetical protein EAZ55_14300 [Cytophagales bacterium]